MSSSSAARPASAPRWPRGTAVALAVALVVGVLIAAAIMRGQALGPLALAAIPAPSAESSDCTRLLTALPGTLDGGEMGAWDRRQLATPAPAGTAGWGEPPVVLRCGLSRPAELTATSRLLDVSGVQFLEIANPDTSTWVAVDRAVYIVVALPPASGSGPLQQIAAVISNTLPRRDVNVTG